MKEVEEDDDEALQKQQGEVGNSKKKEMKSEQFQRMNQQGEGRMGR